MTQEKIRLSWTFLEVQHLLSISRKTENVKSTPEKYKIVLALLIFKGFLCLLCFYSKPFTCSTSSAVKNKHKTYLDCTSMCTRIFFLLQCWPTLYKFWHHRIIIVNYLKSWDISSSKLNFWQISISKSLSTEKIMSVISTVLSVLSIVYKKKELPLNCRRVSQYFPQTRSSLNPGLPGLSYHLNQPATLLAAH